MTPRAAASEASAAGDCTALAPGLRQTANAATGYFREGAQKSNLEGADMVNSYPGATAAAKPKPKPAAPKAPKRPAPARREPGRPKRPAPGRRKPAPAPRPSPKAPPKPAPKRDPRPFTPAKREPAPGFGKKKKPLPATAKPGLRIPRPDLLGLIGGVIGIAQPWDYFWPPQGPRDYSLNLGPGWTFCWNCSNDPAYPLGPYFTLVNSSACGAIPCLTNQGVTPTPGNLPPQVVGKGFIRPMMTVWEGRALAVPNPIWPGNYRFHALEQHRIPAGSPQNDALEYRNRRVARGMVPYFPPVVMPDPYGDPGTEPSPNPAPAPAPAPAPSPSPTPAPGVLPYAPPGTSPQPDPSTEPAPAPGIVPIPLPVPMPLPMPVPGSPPYVSPGTSLDVSPRPGTGFAPNPWPQPNPGYAFTPPPRGTREAKLKSNAVTEVFKGLINMVTESADAVNALYYAIRWEDRREGGAVGFMSPLDKASFVWSNFHLIDFREFLRNFMKNQAEDYIYGQLGRGSAWMQGQGGISQGFKDAALGHRGSAGKGGGGLTDRDGNRVGNPAVDAVNELIDALMPSDPAFTRPTPYRRRPVVKNWRRINKWTKRNRG